MPVSTDSPGLYRRSCGRLVVGQGGPGLHPGSGLDHPRMFDAIACAYDLLAANPERQRREGPFLERWAGSGTRILDLACGTGVHAALLAASAGRRITAVDLSPAMLARAREARPHPAITWLPGDMRAPPAGPFERVMILGNSLNLLPDRQAVAATLTALRGALMPEGRLLVQVVDPCHPRHQETRQVVKRGVMDGVDLTMVKTLVPQDGATLLSLAVYARHGDGAVSTGGEQAVLLDLDGEGLEALCVQAGFTALQRYGGLDGSPYAPGMSGDVVVDCRR